VKIQKKKTFVSVRPLMLQLELKRTQKSASLSTIFIISTFKENKLLFLNITTDFLLILATFWLIGHQNFGNESYGKD
jgi:hypothetical protein